MRRLLSLLMGLNEVASPTELRKQYQKIITALMAAQVDSTPCQIRRYETAIERLSAAFEKARKQLNSSEELHGSVTGSGVLLGEILIDAGVLTPGQLEDALQSQAKMKPPLPIGRILVARNLITWDQLAYYLKLQDLLQLSPFHPQRLARQVLELGLASKSEIEMAEFDCETTGYSMFHVIQRRGWISAAILAVLTGSSERPQTAAPAPAPVEKVERPHSTRKLTSAPGVFG